MTTTATTPNPGLFSGWLVWADDGVLSGFARTFMGRDNI